MASNRIGRINEEIQRELSALTGNYRAQISDIFLLLHISSMIITVII